MPESQELTQYDLWILDIVNELFDEQQQWLVVAKNSYPNVKIITLGMGLPEGYLTNLMSAGIVGHIDRKLTRPQDLVLLIKTIINPNRLLQEY
jgi:DNA-binding NarL/FixJ family response regulator